MDELDLKWQSMAKGIDAQPAYVRGGAARALFAAADDLPLKLPSRIYLVGCGDSHYAGLAVRHAFERWSGIPTEALESLEFSRYAVESAPSDALVTNFRAVCAQIHPVVDVTFLRRERCPQRSSTLASLERWALSNHLSHRRPGPPDLEPDGRRLGVLG